MRDIESHSVGKKKEERKKMEMLKIEIEWQKLINSSIRMGLL